jgi:outer membrane protein
VIRKTLKIAAVFLAISLVAGVGARAESLTDALISAYRSSGLLEQNRALLRAADEDVARATAGLRPILNYALSAQYSSITQTTSSNLQLSASMMLFDFGRSGLRVDLARENVLALREALVGVEQAVLLRAVAAYANVQRDTSIVALRENNLRLITQELRAAQDRFDVGAVTRTDVAIAQARLASSNSALAAARGNLAVSREEYHSAVGRRATGLAALPAPPATAKSLAAARALARQRHPDMAQAQHSVAIADLNVELARAAIKPALSGSAMAAVNQDGNDSSSVGITLSGPIYQGGALASAYRKAAAQRDAARAGLHLAGLKVDQDVGNAWARLTVADARLQATEQQIRASRVAYRGTKQEAELGSRTTLDVLNAEQELLDAEAGRVSAETDRYIAVYNLLAAMGLLTADHLRLGLATYDPAAYYDAVKSAPTYRVSPQGKRLDSLLKSIGKK